MLKIKNISVRLGSFELNNVSFDVEEGDYFVILGESGVGKSVLLEILAGIISPASGKIYLDEKNITNKPIQTRGLGLVYQDQALFPHMTVRKNIEFPLKCLGLPRNKRHSRIRELAVQVGISEFLDRSTETLSLGEAQRVALGRTLAAKPEILLLDEPLASLDIQAKAKMRSLLRKINRSGQTIMHVTHDYEEAIALASKLAILESGSVTQTGTPDEIFHHPESEFVANFAGIKNFYHGELIKTSENMGLFKTNGLEFEVATSEESGKRDFILSSESITISKKIPESSARNHFKGIITDIEKVRLGMEIIVDIGVNMAVLITTESIKKMNLKIDDEVIVNFKATAGKIL